MQRRFFSGKTIEQARLAAARAFELDPEEVAYVQREKKHGFIKTRRRVVIEVDSDSPKRTPEEIEAARASVAAAEAQASPSRLPAGARRASSQGGRRREREGGGHSRGSRPTPRGGGRFGRDEHHDGRALSVASDLLLRREMPDEEAIGVALREILGLAQLDLRFSIGANEEDEYDVELDGPDRDALLDDDGDLLFNVEHLLSRLTRGLCGRGLRCRVNSRGFLEEREERLRTTALDAAEEVRRTREPLKLEEMSPADRRIVHMALADDSEVRTESEGNGFFKRLSVFPA